MNNPWKLTTIGMVLVLITAITTGLATAYFMGPDEMTSATPRVVYTRNQTAAPAAPRYAASASPRYVAAAAPAVGCDQNGKLVRLAKDGLIGGVLGAAAGAGAGAIADGGRAAGKGAAIGGLAGVLAGGLYGAHQNKTTCGGSVFR